MTEDIKSIMSSDVSAIAEFESACDALLTSKYVLAEAKIKPLMISIAKSRHLYELFGDVCRDFDLEATLASHTIARRLTLPKSRRLAAAMVFVLLLEFDSGRRDLGEFLAGYFGSDPNTDYQQFLVGFVKPFRKAVTDLLRDMLDEPEPEPEPVSHDDDEYFAQPPTQGQDIDAATMEFVIGILRDITAVAASDPTLNKKEREEILLTAEGLSRTMPTRDLRLIKTMYIGFRNTCRQQKNIKSISSLIEELARRLNSVI